MPSRDEDATTPATPRGSAASALTLAGLPSRYRVLGRLGKGGMGQVFRAHDSVLGREVAVKLVDEAIRQDPGRRARFVREARAIARLDHPNIVHIHDADDDAGYLVMEVVEGESLRARLARGPLSPEEGRPIADGLLAALAAVHDAGVVHRDIKPANVIVRADGRPTLIDFGVARLSDNVDVTRTGDSPGTPAYMAPEQLRGAEIDGRTDLWSLGAMLYELLVGQRLGVVDTPGRTTSARLGKACGRDRALAAVILRCLAADKEDRFSGAAAALDTLRRRRLGRSRSRLALIALAVVAFALGALAVVWGLRARPRPTSPGDPRLVQAWALAQRDEFERARDLVRAVLAERPADRDALVLDALVRWWTGALDSETVDRVLGAPIDPAQRSLVQALNLIDRGRYSEATAFLREVDRDHPGRPEVLYALGESLFHGQEIEASLGPLERAFDADPRWQLALHHVVEVRLGDGQVAELEPLITRLEKTDPEAAVDLRCQVLVALRRYDDAAAAAQAGLAIWPDSAHLFARLTEAHVLAGDLGAAERDAAGAFERWPVDDREFGGFSHKAELLLYRGDVEGYAHFLGSKETWVRILMEAIWLGRGRERPPAVDGVVFGARKPGYEAVFRDSDWAAGRNDEILTRNTPEPELQAYGVGLGAELRGDPRGAVEAYERGLTLRSRGDIRMLLGHHLARARRAAGDRTGAAAACDEVLHPRQYQVYRAVLLPDCLVWTAEATSDPAQAKALYRRLVDAWTGSFAHPAVVTARSRL
jgi:tetratricopeptide (TPR) repeat protein